MMVPENWLTHNFRAWKIMEEFYRGEKPHLDQIGLWLFRSLQGLVPIIMNRGIRKKQKRKVLETSEKLLHEIFDQVNVTQRSCS